MICIKKYTVKPTKSSNSFKSIRSLTYNKKTNGPRSIPKEVILINNDKILPSGITPSSSITNIKFLNNKQSQQQPSQQQPLIDKTAIPLNLNPLVSYYPLLESLLKDTFSTPFLYQTDPKMMIMNNQRPMDLNTVKYKFNHGKYNTSDDFANDIRSIFRNICSTPHIHQGLYINILLFIYLNRFLMADTLLKEFDKSYLRIKASEQSLLLAQKRAAEEQQQTLPSPLSVNSTTSSTRTSRSRLSKKRKLNTSNTENINENEVIYYNPTPTDEEIITSNDQMDLSTIRLNALDSLMVTSFPNKKDITNQEYENLKNGLKKLTRPEDISVAYQLLTEDPYYEDKRNEPNIKFQLRNLDITTLLELHEFLKTVSIRTINVQQMRKKNVSI